MSRRSFCRMSSLSLLAAALGCASFEGRFPPDSSVPMTAQAVAEAALLTGTSWEPIPFKLRTGAEIGSLEIVGDTIYAVDSTATAHAIDLAQGTHRWVLNLGRMPTRPVAVGSDHVAFLSKSHMTVATRLSGTLTLRKDLEFTPSSDAALTFDTLYAGAWGNGTRLRSVSITDGWQGWFYGTDAPVTSGPVVAGAGADKMVYFTSEDGRVIALPPRPASAAPPAEVNWETRTLGRNSADLVCDDLHVYVASEDHALYALNRTAGTIVWKWLDANCPLHDAPVVAGDTVYQPFEGTLAALDRMTGVEKYRYCGAERFLTRIDQRDYLKLHEGGIAVVDAATGEELAVVRSPLLAFVPSNPAGAALVFSDGRDIFSLR